MTNRRRAVIALGLTLAWYAAVVAVLASAYALFGSVDPSAWPVRMLLFPLGLLAKAAELFLGWYDPRNKPGHPWHTPGFLIAFIVVAHVLSVWLVFYFLTRWWSRRKALGLVR